MKPLYSNSKKTLCLINKLTIKNLLLISPLFIFSHICIAETNETVTLEPITIRGVSTLENISGSFASQNVSTFEQDKLEIGHERSLDDVLEGESGVSVSKQNATGRLYVRGTNGFGMLMLDGMPVPDTVPNSLNLNALIPDGLERVEVNRGYSVASRPFSALGGTISMTSREAKDDSVNLRVEGGTFGTLRETLSTNLIHHNARLAVTANRTDTFDGAHQAPSQNNPERDPYHNTQVIMRSDIDINNALTWQGSMLYRNNVHSQDRTQKVGNTFQQVDVTDSYTIDEVWMAQNTLALKINDDWISRLKLGYTQNYLRNIQPKIRPSVSTDFFLARWENDQRVWKNDKDSINLIWGVEERHESGQATTIVGIPPNNSTGAFVTSQRNQIAGFLDTRFVFGDVSSDVGVRYESYDRFEDQTLFHVGTAWQATKSVKWLANVGNGFRLPSYSEWLFPVPGNVPLGLKPESSVGGDMGVEWQALSNLKLNATGFYSRFENLISMTWQPQPTPCVGFCLANIQNAVIAGAESSAEMVFNKNWRGGLSYTYTDTRNLANNLELPFRPAHNVKVWGEWHTPILPLTLWAEGIYRSMAQNDVANVIPLGDNFRVNLQANYKIAPEVNLYVRGENLANDQTQNTFSFNQTGATVFGGIAVKLW